MIKLSSWICIWGIKLVLLLDIIGFHWNLRKMWIRSANTAKTKQKTKKQKQKQKQNKNKTKNNQKQNQMISWNQKSYVTLIGLLNEPKTWWSFSSYISTYPLILNLFYLYFHHIYCLKDASAIKLSYLFHHVLKI